MLECPRRPGGTTINVNDKFQVQQSALGSPNGDVDLILQPNRPYLQALSPSCPAQRSSVDLKSSEPTFAFSLARRHPTRSSPLTYKLFPARPSPGQQSAAWLLLLGGKDVLVASSNMTSAHMRDLHFTLRPHLPQSFSGNLAIPYKNRLPPSTITPSLQQVRSLLPPIVPPSLWMTWTRRAPPSLFVCPPSSQLRIPDTSHLARTVAPVQRHLDRQPSRRTTTRHTLCFGKPQNPRRGPEFHRERNNNGAEISQTGPQP